MTAGRTTSMFLRFIDSFGFLQKIKINNKIRGSNCRVTEYFCLSTALSKASVLQRDTNWTWSQTGLRAGLRLDSELVSELVSPWTQTTLRLVSHWTQSWTQSWSKTGLRLDSDWTQSRSGRFWGFSGCFVCLCSEACSCISCVSLCFTSCCQICPP